MMRLTEAIEELVLETEANDRSPRTVEAYRQKLRPLVEFLGDVPVEAVKARDLRRYVCAQRELAVVYVAHPTRPPVARSLSRATIRSRVRALRRLFRFLVADGVIDDDPAQRLTATVPKAEPKGVNWRDVAAMVASTSGGSVVDLRDRALLWFLSDTGCRAGGLVRLRRGDLDVAQGIARVTEKGDRRRAVFFGPETAEALRDVLALRPRHPAARVFVSYGRKGGALKAGEVTHILNRRAVKAGVTGRVNAHAFRHGFAREYLEHGGDLATLAAILGHADSSVTVAFYAVFAERELKAMHAKHSPAGAVLEAMHNGD